MYPVSRAAPSSSMASSNAGSEGTIEPKHTIDPKQLEAAFSAHAEWVQSAGARGEQLFLMDADLSGIDWSGKNLTEAWLAGARLVGAKLCGAVLYGSNLCSAILDGGDLSGAQFAKSQFDYVSALGTNFRACNALRTTFMDLRATNLDRVSFAETRVAGVRLSGAFRLEKAVVQSIDVGRAGQSEELHGEAAKAWLRQATLR
jgi:uncharacterized protein YjbI with pentapeptide repeats